ncbi:tetratricopeptide repeat protein [Catellatospora sp. NPDC049133]|uniref:tetratricopeptide repeat protein n=1 Tax=Catellatospora sp. NPDC049133 TaxID=3155499 RepID=UPI0033ECFB14
MPSGADLFELIFMGPGLVCIAFLVFCLLLGLLRRHLPRRRQAWRIARAEKLIMSGHTEDGLALLLRQGTWLRRRRPPTPDAALADLLGYHSGQALATGRLDAALTAATASADLIARLRPNSLRHATSLYALGRLLARLGRDETALAHLEQSVAIGDAADPDGEALVSRALYAVGTSLALHRGDRIPEALTMATHAAQLASSAPPKPTDLREMAQGWANVALALAQTDSGLDGCPAAATALEEFRRLDRAKAVKGGEGLALACYAAAYAGHRAGDDQALKAAREAVKRFSELDRPGDALAARRLADARRLLVQITSSPADAHSEEMR